MLRDATVIGFIPTRDAARSRSFYEDVLGLEFVADVNFALVFRVGNGMLRLVRTEQFTPASYTIFGWEVDDLVGKARELARRGVEIARYSFLEQDTEGIWTAPGGDTVLWFKDPDSNTLSLSHHVKRDA